MKKQTKVKFPVVSTSEIAFKAAAELVEKEQVILYNIEQAAKLACQLPKHFEVAHFRLDDGGFLTKIECVRDVGSENFHARFYDHDSLEATKRGWNYIFENIKHPDSLTGWLMLNQFV